MKKLVTTLILGGALACATAMFAKAETIISASFGGPGGAQVPADGATGAVSAVDYNNITTPAGLYAGSSTPITLMDSTGSTAANVELSSYQAGINGGDTGATGGGTAQKDLFDGGLDNNYGPATFTLSGLSAFSSYAIYAYFDAYDFGTARYATLSDGTTTFYTGGISDYAGGATDADPIFVESSDTTAFDTTTPHDPSTLPTSAFGNYVAFTALTGDTQTITYANNDDNVDLVGFQIVGTLAPAPTPEPSTCALMLGGLGLLIGVVQLRKRNA